ncbi:MAG: outer membrane protein assembly factor BamE [Pseudomonadota bacterium]
MRFVKAVVAVFFASVLLACSPTFDNHGYVPEPDVIEQLQVGTDDKLTVEERIGRPSSTGVLDEQGWYYIQTRIRNFAYQQPEVIEREILAISFDSSDRISNIETLTLTDGQVIAFNRRVTELPVRGPNFWQQIVASVGNIRAEDLEQ